MSLNNRDGDSITLLDPDKNVVDTAHYCENAASGMLLRFAP